MSIRYIIRVTQIIDGKEVGHIEKSVDQDEQGQKKRSPHCNHSFPGGLIEAAEQIDDCEQALALVK